MTDVLTTFIVVIISQYIVIHQIIVLYLKLIQFLLSVIPHYSWGKKESSYSNTKISKYQVLNRYLFLTQNTHTHTQKAGKVEDKNSNKEQ